MTRAIFSNQILLYEFLSYNDFLLINYKKCITQDNTINFYNAVILHVAQYIL